MKLNPPIFIFASFLLYLLMPNSPAQSWQYSGYCSEGNKAQLEINICYHGVNIANIEDKFENVVIGNRRPSCPPDAVTLEDIQKYLHDLNDKTKRKTAVLFYAFDIRRKRLCTWLILTSEIYSHVKKDIEKERVLTLQPDLMSSFDIKNRAEQYIWQSSDQLETDSIMQSYKKETRELLMKASLTLIPAPFSDKLRKIDTLIVIPIYSFGAVPFHALLINDIPLVDIASVVIAPGFHVFKDQPRKAIGRFANPIIAGLSCYPPDPVYSLKLSPKAAEEAIEVARLFNVDPLQFSEKNASKRNIQKEINSGKSIGLIYISTHGVSDSKNPLDGGVIWLSDGRWTGRDVHDLPLEKGSPLVVLSACQSGLGKTFEAGTIGMARAWYKAGASNVVMSLWRIDATETMKLMTQFMEFTQIMPVDKALQRAMGEAKNRGLDPGLWAGFSILGLPDIAINIPPK